jgi:hypothetical protein
MIKMEDTTEIILTTQSGISHLKLHGWLKSKEFVIKGEQIFPLKNKNFGMFILNIKSKDITKLQECSDLWDSIEYLGNEGDRWDTYKQLKRGDINYIKSIKDFMFSTSSEQDGKSSYGEIPLDELIAHTNETSLALFKKNPEFVDNYLSTKELTKKEKKIDLSQMIEYFEEQERYEDCAILVGIKNKLK